MNLPVPRLRLGCSRYSRLANTCLFSLFGLLALGGLEGCSIDTESLSGIAGDILDDSPQRDDSVQNETPKAIKQVSFEPKYASRIDPFRYPGEKSKSSTEPAFNAEKATSLEVLGFANMDAPRVILRMQETTTSLGIGEKLSGIEVVEITPPTVKLRSGSLVWSASMFGSSM